MKREVVKSIVWALIVAVLLGVAIVVGSRNLSRFDSALVAYTFASLFAAFGLTYRYAMWLQRPPTALYWWRGWEAFFKRPYRKQNAINWFKRVTADYALNHFIWLRGKYRWLAHWLIMWGCIIAALITFPLVFGWLMFESVPGNLDSYRIYVFGFPTSVFKVESIFGFLLFHGLVWAAFLVIAGVMIAMHRRMRDEGAAALQFFREDILVARVCLKTPYTDYNGRLCMVSAGAGNKKAFGVDRAANPWNDILKAEVVWISGANVAECAPITTDYVWQARENGGKVVVVDPRITPIGRTCDLLLPIKPGRDVALFNGILNLMIKNDWVDHSFIEKYTVGFDEVAASVKEWTLERTAKITGIAEKGILQAAEWWGTAKTSFLMHARGIEHSSHGVQNVLGAINIVLASGRIGRESCGYGTITGQANGQGGREHGQKCDQLPGMRDISNPEHRTYVAGVWGVDPNELPGREGKR